MQLLPITNKAPNGGARGDSRSGVHPLVLQRATKPAVPGAQVLKPASVHTFWRSFATLESGHDIRTVQKLFDHSDVKTTMIYTHVLNRGGRGIVSPLDSEQRSRRTRLSGSVTVRE
jgi:integrase